MAKSTKNEVDRRVEIVFNLLIDGWSPMQIHRYTSEMASLPVGHPDRKEEMAWSVGDRQIYDYVDKAEELIDQYRKPNRERAMNKALVRYENLLRRSLAEKDFRTAKSIQERIDKLMGLDEAAKITGGGIFTPPPPMQILIASDVVTSKPE